VIWVAAAFVLAVAAAVMLQRNQLARAQALVMGGMITPGCVVAEAVVLLLLAAALVMAQLTGILR
jgi:hypothetical protein